MRGFGYGFMYATSLGAVILAIENDYITEGAAGFVLIFWGLAGLTLIALAITRRHLEESRAQDDRLRGRSD